MIIYLLFIFLSTEGAHTTSFYLDPTPKNIFLKSWLYKSIVLDCIFHSIVKFPNYNLSENKTYIGNELSTWEIWDI